jgi:exopolysaccharide biosynthesis predicted pyruvyltransferase EpsI
MTFNETDINGFLKQYTGKEVVYCANPGNAGDALIAHATFQLFEKLNIKLQIIRHEEIVHDKIIFYAGGGNLVEGKYKNAYHFINNNFRQNREIIMLPHTVHGYDELLLSAKNLTIFCREKTSYQNLSAIGFPSERLFLAHDMAFQLTMLEFQDYLMNGKGTANCFRLDDESARVFDMPTDNLDISLSWNGELWHRPDFAKNVTHSLACYLSTFETVKTDRLHIAILAGIMGKKVVLYPNNYYKIKAVFEYSIKEALDNVVLIENPIQNETPPAETKINELQDKLKKLEETLQEKELQIAGLRSIAEQLQDVFQSKSWRITKPLRNLISFLKKR